MTYPYAVKCNGKWYRPGENVPDMAENAVEKTAGTVESAIQPVSSQVEEVQSETVVEAEPKRRGRRRKSDF